MAHLSLSRKDTKVFKKLFSFFVQLILGDYVVIRPAENTDEHGNMFLVVAQTEDAYEVSGPTDLLHRRHPTETRWIPKGYPNIMEVHVR